MKNVEGIVNTLLVEMLGVGPDEIKPESTLEGDLGADSLDTVEIAMALEDEFEIEVPDDEFEQVKTVGQLVACITKRLSSPQTH